MKKVMLSVAAAVAMTAAIPAQADTLLGVKVGADAWFANAKVDGHKSDDTSASYYASFEHFIPLVPNFMVRYNNIDTGTVAFEQSDFTAYYEILDNDLVSLDLGLTATKFGSVKLNSDDRFSDWQPTIYGNAEIGIPATPLTVFAQANAGKYDGTRLFDGQAGVKYTIGLVAADLNIRGGYRMMDYDFDKAKNTGDVDLNGWFAGVEVDF
ncbi:TIGR04219 family outer membrane beta-barrel protein [Photobacterium angustum]|uniref:TIGR04219 family outer membrane beta-barrel protein n=1 Tax=Photobacterium angustum TaxID=661 RepID=A0A855SAD1_PHOAN|nr:TIGR04219 family outer membrane beta-barrel protein [Photobacterium angustum]KJF83641.1 ABC-type Fe3+-hydroxamate transport system, periplasmic component [Photobacterium damselae subsp. damselae]KJF92527.1 ABC-type Fe3+-hydroxamate transport system, periplasmic component [Photobacterium angustum]KJG04123.1 ABC-type Fe3+-hydroxamate transport system, periplasmic component [Photobacterium angustum]KJG27752.1 ABC-type Fe3+-hydroxamate transport system, periplasmic component [Photobacterium angu